MLSQRTRYTIRALLHLADRYGQGPVQLAEIAEVQNIPPKFLTVMLSSMRRAGVVESMRGREGGYWLARPPEEISYGEIVRLTRGSLGLLPCASRLAYEPCENCVDQVRCRLHRAMLMVRDETARILDGLKLTDEVMLDEPLDPAVVDLKRRRRSKGDAEQRAAGLALAEDDRSLVGEDDLAGEAEADAGARRLGGKKG
jgi:Rrf2 family protein